MILCSGCFDGLHDGHVRYLEAAKALNPNDELWVVVASDAYIREAKQREPKWPRYARHQVVGALRAVDRVVCGNLVDVILAHRPRMLVKGIDWEERLPSDVRMAAHVAHTAICFVDTEGIHTSERLDSTRTV